MLFGSERLDNGFKNRWRTNTIIGLVAFAVVLEICFVNWMHRSTFQIPLTENYLYKKHDGKEAILLSLLDSTYLAKHVTTHRGGWGAVIRGLHTNGHLLIPEWTTADVWIRRLVWLLPFMEGIISWSPLDTSGEMGSTRVTGFIDCIEQWFRWDKRGVVRRPWIGVAHMLTAELLPQHSLDFKEGILALDNYLESKDFIASLLSCVGLVFLTADMVDHARAKLEKLGASDVNVCVAYHPIGVEADARKFDPLDDLDAATSNDSAVILLGKQYRRLATLHRLQTGRRKIWLPGNVDNRPELDKTTNVELSLEGVKLDSSVIITRAEEKREYDRLVKQNLVVLDMWAASANNAVLESIALQAPFFIRRLPGPEEYLGKDYPLFFSNFDELQEFISSDKKRLRDLLLSAHNHLKAIDRNRFSTDTFAKQLNDCAMRGMIKLACRTPYAWRSYRPLDCATME
jgi:hypothetical protein